MTHPLITVTPKTTTISAFELMSKHKIRRLPVVDSNNKLVGFISWDNLFRCVVKLAYE